MSRPLITLLTDFGTRDSYVAQMKGVILGINPQAVVVDITHEIAPQSIMAGALCLDAAFDAFPPGTIHVAIIDPGVGSERKPIAAEVGSQRFVGPDNGLLTLIARRQPIGPIHDLSQSVLRREPLSPVFHGRDLFSPVAAHWSLGKDLAALGHPSAGPPMELTIPAPTINLTGIVGEVLAIDHFGNITTNIRATDLPHGDIGDLKVTIAGNKVNGLSRCYAQQPIGNFVALIGSSGRLEIAINSGNAAQALKIQVGSRVQVSS